MGRPRACAAGHNGDGLPPRGPFPIGTRSTWLPPSINGWSLPSVPSSPLCTSTPPLPARDFKTRHGPSGSKRHASLLWRLNNAPPLPPSPWPSAAIHPSSPGSLPNRRFRPIPRPMPLPLHSSLGLRPISRPLSPPLLGSLRLWPILRLWSPPPSHSPCLWAPPRFPLLPPRRDRSVPLLLPQPGPWYPLPSPLRLGLPCNCRLPENPANPRPPHPDRSWSRGLTANPNNYRPPRCGMIAT